MHASTSNDDVAAVILQQIDPMTGKKKRGEWLLEQSGLTAWETQT
jgi:hypothetical protein